MAQSPRPTAAIKPRVPAGEGGAAKGVKTIPGTSIRVFRTVEEVRAWRREQHRQGTTVGLVPTMGALHSGHRALVQAAMRENEAVVVSVYVNPAQFGEHEDLDSYPRTWEADCAALAEEDEAATTRPDVVGRVAAVFAPTTATMYPSGPPRQSVDAAGSFVTVTPVGSVLEGASRPTFFRGVATVCMKLFHLVQPDRAYFGQKDVQQTVVIRRIVRDFCVPLHVVVCPTVREPPDGLALSSRNVYLGPRRRAVANVLRRALLAAEAAVGTKHTGGLSGLSPPDILAAAWRVADDTLAAQKQLPPDQRALFEIDYLSLADPDTMLELTGPVDASRGAILSGAVRMLPVEEPQPGEDLGHSGGPLVRLIDNIVLEPVAA
ncbi:pantoate-beta-alanine ligase [Grosmannia clavigera kw1407]|uniref:Pantoate--beta-alanine ligase n=1 Tax=Grosmannia clavigera (strain kw1407 / UAMH 11150) TaxID=655863 RepID=F0XSY8_GROCL|nr:pantoate-beta-alanine ligase [Grosmannia clavigera kw1407]EFW99084.1 pantoate-beta-alanine ligase [Grosmannia clavigera kw1407]